jgi:hypothetical protein
MNQTEQNIAYIKTITNYFGKFSYTINSIFHNNLDNWIFKIYLDIIIEIYKTNKIFGKNNDEVVSLLEIYYHIIFGLQIFDQKISNYKCITNDLKQIKMNEIKYSSILLDILDFEKKKKNTIEFLKQIEKIYSIKNIESLTINPLVTKIEDLEINMEYLESYQLYYQFMGDLIFSEKNVNSEVILYGDEIIQSIKCMEILCVLEPNEPSNWKVI